MKFRTIEGIEMSMPGADLKRLFYGSMLGMGLFDWADIDNNSDYVLILSKIISPKPQSPLHKSLPPTPQPRKRRSRKETNSAQSYSSSKGLKRKA